MKKKGKYNADSISWKGRLNDESSTIIGWREPTNPLDEFSREKRKNGFQFCVWSILWGLSFLLKVLKG